MKRITEEMFCICKNLEIPVTRDTGLENLYILQEELKHWLLDNKNLFVEVDYLGGKIKWMFSINDLSVDNDVDDYTVLYEKEYYESYDDALEDGLLYALKHLSNV